MLGREAYWEALPMPLRVLPGQLLLALGVFNTLWDTCRVLFLIGHFSFIPYGQNVLFICAKLSTVCI